MNTPVAALLNNEYRKLCELLQAVTDEQYLFERYMLDECRRDLQELTHSNKRYDDVDVQQSWEAWQARALIAAAPTEMLALKPREDMLTWRTRFMAWHSRQASDQEVWDAAQLAAAAPKKIPDSLPTDGVVGTKQHSAGYVSGWNMYRATWLGQLPKPLNPLRASMARPTERMLDNSDLDDARSAS